MTTDDMNQEAASVFDSPNAMLRKLVERQGAELKRVNALNEELYAANAKLSGDLLRDSEKRAAGFQVIQGELKLLAARTKTVIHQRDTVLRCLENLVAAIRCEEGEEPDAAQFAASERAIREALELIKVVNDLKAQWAKKQDT